MNFQILFKLGISLTKTYISLMWNVEGIILEQLIFMEISICGEDQMLANSVSQKVEFKWMIAGLLFFHHRSLIIFQNKKYNK